MKGIAIEHVRHKDEMQAVLSDMSQRRTHWISAIERAKIQRGSRKATHVPGMRADYAANTVPSRQEWQVQLEEEAADV